MWAFGPRSALGLDGDPDVASQLLVWNPTLIPILRVRARARPQVTRRAAVPLMKHTALCGARWATAWARFFGPT